MRTAAQKSSKKIRKRKSFWSVTGDVVLIAAFLFVGLYSLYSGVTGFAFGLSRTDSGVTMAHEAAVLAGRVPFSADQLLWFPLAVACLALLGVQYSATRHFLPALLISAAVFALVCAVSLALEMIWVSTGVPFTNYFGDADSSRYVWPIVVFSLGLIASLALVTFTLRMMRTVRAKSAASGRKA